MSEDKLVRMANQIASFFRSYPNDEAAAGIREHIVAYWSPVMRRGLDAQIAQGLDGIEPLVVRAMRSDEEAEAPTHREAEGPAELGQLGADDAG